MRYIKFLSTAAFLCINACGNQMDSQNMKEETEKAVVNAYFQVVNIPDSLEAKEQSNLVTNIWFNLMKCIDESEDIYYGCESDARFDGLTDMYLSNKSVEKDETLKFLRTFLTTHELSGKSWKVLIHPMAGLKDRNERVDYVEKNKKDLPIAILFMGDNKENIDFRASGFFVAPNLLATSLHNVFPYIDTDDKEWFTKVNTFIAIIRKENSEESMKFMMLDKDFNRLIFPSKEMEDICFGKQELVSKKGYCNAKLLDMVFIVVGE